MALNKKKKSRWDRFIGSIANIGTDAAQGLYDTVFGGGDEGAAAPDITAPDFDEFKADNTQVEDITAALYQQMLGLLDTQANTDLTNQQIGSLSDILNQRATMAGKDVAAGAFASGKATPADITPIQQSTQAALAQGITQIQTSEQQRVDTNRMSALQMISSLRNSLSAERQAEFDNSMQTAMFEWQQWMGREGIRLNEDAQEAKKWELITTAVMTAGGFAIGGPAGAAAGAAASQG